MELWQIGDSPFAPKFQIISQPNNWAKAIKSSATGALTNTKLLQLDFWDKFKEYVKVKNSKIRLQTPRPQHWYDISIGSSDAHVALTINSRENKLGCEIYISNNKPLFKWLLENKEKIEEEIGEKCEWVEARVATRLKVSKDIDSLFDNAEYKNYFLWFYERVLIFQKVFGKYIPQYKRTI